MNILNTLDKMRMLNTLNTLEVRYSRYSRSKILRVRRLSILPVGGSAWFLAYCLLTCARPMLTTWTGPGIQDGKVVKLARFKHELGVKIGRKTIKNSLINYLHGYGNYTYHNHETQDPHFLRNIHYLQMINDLQRHFENADNFLLV